MSSRDYYNHDCVDLFKEYGKEIQKGSIEKTLSEVEDRFARAYRDLFTDGGSDEFNELVCHQIARAPLLREVRRSLHDRFADQFPSDPNIQILFKDIDNRHLLTMDKTVQNLMDCLHDLDLILVHPCAGTSFFIGDSPAVINMKPSGYYDAIFYEVNSVFMPLSPEHGLYFSNDRTFLMEGQPQNSKFKIQNLNYPQCIAEKNFVNKVNTLQMLQSRSAFSYMCSEDYVLECCDTTGMVKNMDEKELAMSMFVINRAECLQGVADEFSRAIRFESKVSSIDCEI